MQIKDDFMLEIERWLETEQLYRTSHFSGYFSKMNSDCNADYDSYKLNAVEPMGDFSQRILDIVGASQSGILIEDFYHILSDVDRLSVEEQVSILTLEGLVYTNHGKLFLL